MDTESRQSTIIGNFRQIIACEARSWVGTPYLHYTAKKGLGCDCGLFIMKVYENAGLITFEHPDFYPQDWAFHSPTGEMFEEIVKRYCVEISEDKLDVGDIILYKFGKTLSHASILLERDMIIHSELPIGVKVSNRYTNQWIDRERKYYTWQVI